MSPGDPRIKRVADLIPMMSNFVLARCIRTARMRYLTGENFMDALIQEMENAT